MTTKTQNRDLFISAETCWLICVNKKKIITRAQMCEKLANFCLVENFIMQSSSSPFYYIRSTYLYTRENSGNTHTLLFSNNISRLNIVSIYQSAIQYIAYLERCLHFARMEDFFFIRLIFLFSLCVCLFFLSSFHSSFRRALDVRSTTHWERRCVDVVVSDPPPF